MLRGPLIWLKLNFPTQFSGNWPLLPKVGLQEMFDKSRKCKPLLTAKLAQQHQFLGLGSVVAGNDEHVQVILHRPATFKTRNVKEHNKCVTEARYLVCVCV